MHDDLKLQLDFLREVRARKTLVNFRGVDMSQKEAEEIKALYCSGCGREKGKYPKLWFGETFCGDCVERFQAGM